MWRSNKEARRRSRELQVTHLNAAPAGQDLRPNLEAGGSSVSERVAAVVVQRRKSRKSRAGGEELWKSFRRDDTPRLETKIHGRSDTVVKATIARITSQMRTVATWGPSTTPARAR